MNIDPWKESAARFNAANPWTKEDEERVQKKSAAEAAMYAAQADEPCEDEDEDEEDEQ